ncbi:MAG: transcription antitermination factor NusB [Chlamydia sp.]
MDKIEEVLNCQTDLRQVDAPDALKRSIPPAKFREVVFLFAYALEFYAQDNTYELSEMVMNELKVARGISREALQFALEILREKRWLDSIIKEVIVGYNIDRLKSAEHTILRVCLFEMMAGDPKKRAIPPKVAIAEGKRLGKKFATPQASTFIHAVIAAVASKNDLFFEVHEDIPDIQENLLMLQDEEQLEKETGESQGIQQCNIDI